MTGARAAAQSAEDVGPGAHPDLGPSASRAGAVDPAPAAWCSGLRKRYGRRDAVHDVSLRVDRGDVVGLLGPNGAGKTTVIKMLLGLVRPDGGEAMILGLPAADPTARARVGYLPELFRYQPWLSAAEVLALHVRLSGADVPARERAECLALVGLAERAGDRVGGFSKGMQQRLGLAVALVARPELVVLDEPTSALDPLGRADVRDIVLDFRSRGVAVLLNSHLIGEVERVCDRVVVLDRGRVAASGTLAELLGRLELRLRLTGLTPAAHARLAEAGDVERSGNWFTVTLPDASPVGRAPGAHDGGNDGEDGTTADLVGDLVALGARVHAVEPARISLEDRLLGILREGSERRTAEPAAGAPAGAPAGGDR